MKVDRNAAVRAFVFTCLVSLPIACASVEALQPGATPAADAVKDTELERDKLNFEVRKHAELLALEEKKLAVEGRQGWVTAVATGVPILVGLITLVFGVWSLRQQGQLQFELKAAEIMFQGTTPSAVRKRGEFLKAIFGSRFPADFLSSFAPEPKEPSEQKLLLLDYLLKYPDRHTDVVQLWDQLFPGDQDWLQRVLPPTGASGGTPATTTSKPKV